MKRLHKRFLLATFCALFTATLQAADVTITVNGRVVAGFAPIFPDTCYHLTHYWPAAVDIPV
ncbi:hypothetical protein ACK6VR_23125, partial [Escherichia coli]